MKAEYITILHIKDTGDYHAFGCIAACVDYLNQWFPDLSITRRDLWNAHLSDTGNKYEKGNVEIFKLRIVRKYQN